MCNGQHASRPSGVEPVSPVQDFSLHISESASPIFFVGGTAARFSGAPRNFCGPGQFDVRLHVIKAGEKFFRELNTVLWSQSQRVFEQSARVLRHLGILAC